MKNKLKAVTRDLPDIRREIALISYPHKLDKSDINKNQKVP